MEITAQDPLEHGNLRELAAVVCTGAGHVAVELLAAPLGFAHAQHVYNVAAVAAWAGYVLWRWRRTPDAARAWGFRGGRVARSLRACALLAALAAVPLVAYGAARGRWPLPPTFWLVCALYPLWGLAQQFALQALVTRNLRPLVPRPAWRALAAAALFSAAHFPNLPLMLLTLVAGVGFTWVYERYRDLWTVGVAHGLLGALAYYLVLGQDPGGAIWNWLTQLGVD